MNTLIIKQKPSNSGSIHDIESDMFDRKIVFPRNKRFAVILSSYYGGNLYSVHSTQELAIKKYLSQLDYSQQILDCDGNIYSVDVYGKKLYVDYNIFDNNL